MGGLLINRPWMPQRRVCQAQGRPGPKGSHSEGPQSQEEGAPLQRPPQKRMSAGGAVHSSRVRMIAAHVKSMNRFSV